MPLSILPPTVAVPRPPTTGSRSISSISFLSGPCPFPAAGLLSSSSLSSRDQVIRMGGGPRTFPGGVTKWQWKRMQAKKAKQLLKARLCRERQLYEMRKRAELKAAVAELERPWEVVERAPNLFSVRADEQLKILADRFQRPGGFDMWNDRDGPQVFRSPIDGLPSARFFPKGVVHSVKPYGRIAAAEGGEKKDGAGVEEDLRFDDWIARGGGGTRRSARRARGSLVCGGSIVDVEEVSSRSPESSDFDSKSSSFAVNLESRSSRSSVVDRRGVVSNVSGDRRKASNAGPIVSSRKLDNGGRKGFRNQISRNQYSKGEEEEFDSSISNGNGRRKGFESHHSPKAVDERGNAREAGKTLSNSRQKNGNRRYSTAKISLRPTTELNFNNNGSSRRGSAWFRDDNGFGRNIGDGQKVNKS